MRNLIIALVLLMVAVPAIYADTTDTDTCNLLIAPVSAVSINISETQYDFGSVDLGASTVNSTAITVENSGQQSATWAAYASNSTGDPDWTLQDDANLLAEDKFRICGMIQTDQPSMDADFDETNTAQRLGTAAGEDIPGAGTVTQGQTKSLWLRFEMPPTCGTGHADQQTITLSILATGV